MDIEFPVYGLVFSYLKINTLLRRKQDSIPHFFCGAQTSMLQSMGQPEHSQLQTELHPALCLHSAKWPKKNNLATWQKSSVMFRSCSKTSCPPDTESLGHLYAFTKIMILQEVMAPWLLLRSCVESHTTSCNSKYSSLFTVSQSFPSGAHPCQQLVPKLLWGHCGHTSTSMTTGNQSRGYVNRE